MEVEKNEKNIKARLAITSSISTEGVGGRRLGAKILEELKEIREMQQKFIIFMEYQHNWNKFIQGQCETPKINISNVPIVHETLFVVTSGTKQQESKEKPKDSRAPPAEQKIKTKIVVALLSKDRQEKKKRR